MEAELEDLKLSVPALLVQYCSISTLPFEYCSFSAKPNVCDGSSHEANEPVTTVAATTEPTAAVSKPVSVAKAVKGAKKAKIVISTVERTKRKRVTHVSGLELFGNYHRSALYILADIRVKHIF